MTTTMQTLAPNTPTAFQTPADPKTLITQLITYARAHDASDLHIGAEKVAMEIYGLLYDVAVDPIAQEHIEAYIKENLSTLESERVRGAVGVADGRGRNDADGTVRIHAYKCRRRIHLSLRLLQADVPRFEDLNLPIGVRDLTEFQSGIVLFTGKTGEGKSTALASLIDIINREQRRHIYTLEDPIEYVHKQHANCVISQTEVGTDVLSYEEGLRGMLRAAPKVMMFAELRDDVSVTAALRASASGHLVFSTLHTSEAMETVQRIVNYFPPEQHTNVRYQFAQALRASVSLRLLPRLDGKGRLPACEVLINTKAVQQMLEDPEKTKQIHNAIKTGQKDGMQSLEKDLSRLIAERLVHPADAKRATNHPDEVEGDVRSGQVL